MKINKPQNLPVWISIVIALSGVFLSYLISERTIKIANDAKNINESNLGIQLDQISQGYVSKAYDELYYNADNSFVMKLLRNKFYVKDKYILLRVVDTFEGIGSGACQGTIKFRHIRPYLKNSLSYVCDNQQIIYEFGGKRNGISILCHELFPSSIFAKLIDTTNISTCEFWDSLSFPNSLNRDRFQVK